MTASSAGTSIPSERQRAFERMRQALAVSYRYRLLTIHSVFPIECVMLSIDMLCFAFKIEGP